MKKKCIQCGKPFECERKWKNPRVICDGCRAVNTRSSQKDYKRRFKGQRLHHVIRTTGLSPAEVASQLNTTAKAVGQLERVALKKIMRHAISPELKALWFESPVGWPASELMTPDPGLELMDYQMAVADWWCTYDKIFALGAKEEALECLLEIEKCQKAIKNQLLNRC